MKTKKPKTLDEAVAAVTAAVQEDLQLEQPEWKKVDEALRGSAKDLFDKFVAFAELVQRAYDCAVWTHFGYNDAQHYFVERIGIAERTFYRYLKIQQLVRSLPLDEQQAAMEKLAKIGSMKAALVAGACEKDPGQFDDWVEQAEHKSEDALKEQVDKALGKVSSTTDKGEPGTVFLNQIVTKLPPEHQDRCRKIFGALIRQAGDSTTIVGAFILMLDLTERDLGDAGIEI